MVLVGQQIVSVLYDAGRREPQARVPRAAIGVDLYYRNRSQHQHQERVREDQEVVRSPHEEDVLDKPSESEEPPRARHHCLQPAE